jgi:2-keto-4-pentenoate hydratase/2-oxohepta-3-ene-1,7-dioic acid hydratase in catechol pathway
MRFMSYRRGSERGWGAVIDGGVVEMAKRTKHADLKSAIAAGALAECEKAAKGAKADLALADVTFELPVPNAEKIFCVGRNYPEYHEVAEMNARPKYPSIFPRWASSFAAHGEAILKPKASDQLDFEGELAVVIGTRGRHLPAERAFDHIVGYTCLNEGSVRDWQGYGTQNCPGKNFYHSGSIGPWMVTRDEIADPMALALKTRLNGETLQDNKVGEMLFDIPYVLAHVSKFTWIEPGDLITMGSPGGTIISRKTGKWMKAGDTFELEIEKIGTLRNPVAAE